MNEYQALLNEFAEVEAKICPPQREISESEHLKAHFRMAFEELFSYTYSIERLAAYALKPTSEQNLSPEDFEKMKKHALDSMKMLDQYMDEEEKEPWEAIISPQRMEYLKDGLTSMHSGDCTAFACSCERCHAENYYKLPYTAKWSKSEGSKLYSRYIQLHKDKTTIEQAMKMENELLNKTSIEKRTKI